MEPRLNQKVYTLVLIEQGYYTDFYGDVFIFSDFASFLGGQSFVIADYRHRSPCEWFYEDFGKTWFTTIASAKEYAEKIAKKKLKWYRWSDGVRSTLPEPVVTRYVDGEGE